MVEFALDAYLEAKQRPKLILVGWMPENLAVSADRLTAAADPLYQTPLFNTLPTLPLAVSLAGGGHGRLFWGLVEHRLMPPSAHHRDRLADWFLGNTVMSEDEQRLFESFRRTGSFLLYHGETAPPDAVASYERGSGGFAPESAVANAAPVSALSRKGFLGGNSGFAVECPFARKPAPAFRTGRRHRAISTVYRRDGAVI